MTKTIITRIYLLLGLVLIHLQGLSQVEYGVNNYTQYHSGTLPIVISVPHGGLVAPASIPDRTCSNPTTVTDSYTIELARQIDTALFNLTGCRPHLIICNLDRIKLDCNRNMVDGACGNLEAETAWNEFQDFIDTAQSICQNTFNEKAFYIDLHGHGKPILRLELGYGLFSSELNNTDSFLNTPAQIGYSSIGDLVSTNVNGYTHSELLRGEFALGTLLANAGFPSVPSQQTPSPDTTAYYSGGYNTVNHTCINPGNTVNGLQIECHQTVRFTYPERKKFADSMAVILAEFLDIHQNLDLFDNCGMGTNSISDAGQNTIQIFPNPVGNELHISTENLIGNFEVRILNSIGELVLLESNQSTIRISHLASGIYVVQIVDEGEHFLFEKIVKQE